MKSEKPTVVMKAMKFKKQKIQMDGNHWNNMEKIGIAIAESIDDAVEREIRDIA